jgi:hypothetical protein
MWPWIILGVVWLAAAYQAGHAYRRGRMAEPANVLAAIAARVRIALGYGIALAMLLLGALASLLLANAEHNRVASWVAAGSAGVALLGSVVLWKWFWKRRRRVLP